MSSAAAISNSASSLAVALVPSRRRAAPLSASRTCIELGQTLGLVLCSESGYDFVQTGTGKDLVKAVDRQVDAMIGHAPLREIVRANALRTVTRSDHRLARPGAFA